MPWLITCFDTLTCRNVEAEVEIEDKVEKLQQRLEEEGPFDVVIGFSQGRMEDP